MAIDQISPFIIQEITGENLTQVRLVGRALPYRPYTLTTSQRANFTWYPGNPVATSTLLGAKEDPTQIDGTWKDKYIQPFDPETGGQNEVFAITVDGVPVENVREAVEVMDRIVRQGQLLEITWDETKRHGHLMSFTKRWLNVHDVEWSMNFEWISRGEQDSPVVFAFGESANDTASTLQRLARALRIDALPAPFPALDQFNRDMDAVIGAIEGDINAISDTVTEVVEGTTAPIAATRRTVAILTGTIGRAQEVRALVDSEVMGGFNALVQQGSGLATLIRGSSADQENIGDLSFGERLEGGVYARDVTGRSEDIRRTAIQRRSRLLSDIDQDVQVRIIARGGENLRDIAERELGDEREWRRLLIFNELTTPVLTAGQLVLVPRRDAVGLAGC